ncbi:MAG TPA: outer membrane protein assembly factor BamD [Steroidobacteraceae bacterium]|nr:outer membrane protein assembly factor BamD [Steroidobacteraceae bacterium]
MPASTARRALLLLALCINLVLAGCASHGNSRLQRLARNPPGVLYELGRRALHSHDYQAAVDAYEALTTQYSLTAEARQARLELIYVYYKLDEKESARDAADTFIKEDPTHPNIDYAYYVRGLVDFENAPMKIELLLGGDPTARPPETARDAIDSFRTVVTKYPASIYAADARRRMIYMRNRLADFELKAADYYMQRGAWVAAAQRARQAVEQYDGAPAVKDALRVMIVCYRKLQYTDLADNTLRVFRENFPGQSPDLPQHEGLNLVHKIFGGGSPSIFSGDNH